MPDSNSIYRVGLLLKSEIEIEDYQIRLRDIDYTISFHCESEVKYCDLVITDKEVAEISNIPIQLKDTHGTVLVISNVLSPIDEGKFEEVFSKANVVKFRKAKLLSKVKSAINLELVKQKVNDGKLKNFYFVLNQYTSKKILSEFSQLIWLFVPVILIILYFSIHRCNERFSLSYLIPSREGSLETNQEVAFFIIFYSIFNLKFYYDYILSFFDNINIEVFQNRFNKIIHNVLHFFVPIVLFFSTLIIIKELYVLIFSYEISALEGVNILSIFENTIPFVSVKYLIITFIIIDLFLWIIAINFSAQLKKNSYNFTSKKQKIIIRRGQRSFQISLFWDIIIGFGLPLLFVITEIDSFDLVIMQLIFLQIIYLYLNLRTIREDFKYN